MGQRRVVVCLWVGAEPFSMTLIPGGGRGSARRSRVEGDSVQGGGEGVQRPFSGAVSLRTKRLLAGTPSSTPGGMEGGSVQGGGGSTTLPPASGQKGCWLEKAVGGQKVAG